jgi:DNA-binding NtrC family response regulator
MSQEEHEFKTPGHSAPVFQKEYEPVSRGSGMKKRVLVFSPDADLARFLLMNLEDKFQIIREHRLDQFERTIQDISPDLVLVDLYTFPVDIIKQLDIVRRRAVMVPVIALRAYMTLTPEINKSIDDLVDNIFYKPADVDLISQAIEDLLN